MDVGGSVTQLAVGSYHTCALLGTGAVRCWGRGHFGVLGYGHTNHIGDDETPASAGDVDVGGKIVHIDAGGQFTCALLATGGVRCWGVGFGGQLGSGNLEHIGDNETPASVSEVELGGSAARVATGGNHACVLLTSGQVRCWGRNDLGQLGYGNKNAIGDDETPASVSPVDVGGTVEELRAGANHNCVLLTLGGVRCWGRADNGELGYGNRLHIGDDETPASVGLVPVR